MNIDLDAILAKREEVTGSKDAFTFTFAGREWTMKDPIVADDDWKDELSELSSDNDVAEHYMGSEQYAEFRDAGGRSGIALLALTEFMKTSQDEFADGRPTRRSTSSARRRKR